MSLSGNNEFMYIIRALNTDDENSYNIQAPIKWRVNHLRYSDCKLTSLTTVRKLFNVLQIV